MKCLSRPCIVKSFGKASPFPDLPSSCMLLKILPALFIMFLMQAPAFQCTYDRKRKGGEYTRRGKTVRILHCWLDKMTLSLNTDTLSVTWHSPSCSVAHRQNLILLGHWFIHKRKIYLSHFITWRKLYTIIHLISFPKYIIQARHRVKYFVHAPHYIFICGRLFLTHN